ncbi:VCBS repeat-containing protein [Mongoliitalea lutea]|uniref:VCBS repeat-containing protein n=1 Tax=Mongoliitalea lutea TaxID=849756 RepID=UPI0016742990|nr:VCBS repeat-containing protein [Mongoliitalea lutea]
MNIPTNPLTLNKRYGVYLQLAFACIFISLIGCNPESSKSNLFQLLPPSKTGINFNNEIKLDENFNILDFDYIYNGAGVAVGDFNNDGLPDLFFTGNQVSSRLFLNQGKLQFKDVSEKSNISTKTWAEGVTLVDINHDGLLDIYISVSNRDERNTDPNLLFINQGLDKDGVPYFEEMASAYGVDDRGYNTQAAFFDYDGDGFLDLYILSNAMESFQRNTSRPREKSGRGKSNDKLYKNNGDGTFTNVSKEAGILIEGYGLGLAISDINQDGFPDIYVANDFLTNDILYINNGDGTFSNQIDQKLKHQSFNAMGVDIADFNNDGLVDIMVVDMFPPDNLRQKTMFAPTANYDLFMSNLSIGYEPQYVRNTLQLNQGNGLFSEIGFLSGVAQTDWSWSPLFADFDNDGYKDLFISNGYGKDITDMDFINFNQTLGPFTTPEQRRMHLLEGLSKLPEVNLANFLFKNNYDLTFTDKSKDWGMIHASISNGAAYADLDNDGDLELIINNLNENAYLYQNLSREKHPKTSSFIKFDIKGPPQNTMGLGTKLVLEYYANEKKHVQYYEHYPTRGYKSFVEPKAHFGLGEKTDNLKLTVTWPDGKRQIINNLTPDTTVTLDYQLAENTEAAEKKPLLPDFEEVSAKLGLLHTHQHRVFNDFNRQVLLPHKHSENGPGMAVGDVNGDGLDDLFIGGSAGFPRYLFIQNQDGEFSQKEIFIDAYADDMGCLLIDIDNDGDLDLYVVSGGSRHTNSSDFYYDRLYLNDGNGHFEQFSDKIPSTNFSGSVVTAADIDGDGNFELFIGGRVSPGRYPEIPPSVLLTFEEGKFIDVTDAIIPEIKNYGMITSAVWTDFDQDGLIDLIVVGEWMPITFFKQYKENGSITLENVSSAIGPKNSEGWWNSIYSIGTDKNGNPQYILGNAGRNTRWAISEEKPLTLIANDFDKNGSMDPIIFSFLQDGFFPIASRDKLVNQVPSWKNRFLRYSDFANYNLDNFFTKPEKTNAIHLQAKYFKSATMHLGESGTFVLTPLPIDTQFSPTFGIHHDYIHKELFLTGNFYGNETVTGRYDASIGNIIGLDKLHNYSINKKHSGFLVDGEGRSMVTINHFNGESLIAAKQHQGPLKVFRNTQNRDRLNQIQLEPDDFKVVFELDANGHIQVEFPYGQGYLSQSSRNIPIPTNCKAISISKFNGDTRVIIHSSEEIE